MREGIKITVPYQFGYMMLKHIAAAGVAFMLITVAFLWCLEKTPLKEILSIIFTLIYAGMIYSGSNQLSIKDNKPYTPLKPNNIKPFLWGIMIAATNFIVYAFYVYAWKYVGFDGGWNRAVMIISNTLFSYWTFPYVGIMGASQGRIMWYSYILWVLVPIASSVGGYIAGNKGFMFLEKLNGFMYKKEK